MLGAIALVLFMVAVWAAVMFAVVSYNTLCWSYVITKCWLWLAVPAFGVAALTFPQAVVVGMFISLIGAKMFIPSNEFYDSMLEDDVSDEEKAAKKKRNWAKIAYFVLLPWIALVLTWIVKIVFI